MQCRIASTDFFGKLATQCTALTHLTLKQLHCSVTSSKSVGSLAAATGLPRLRELVVIDVDLTLLSQPGVLERITRLEFFHREGTLNTKLATRFISLRHLSQWTGSLPLETFKVLLSASSCLEEVQVSACLPGAAWMVRAICP